jgi:1-deoxy-D-xylulose-5-phosphate reductoisomerase
VTSSDKWLKHSSARPGDVFEVTQIVRHPLTAVRREERSRITVLGATGSIGTSTLDLIERNPGAFEVIALTAMTNVDELAAIATRTAARIAVIGDESLYPQLAAALAGTSTRAAAGHQALIEAASEPADCIVAAIAGAAGLAPSLAAVRQGSRVALANKECLVAAGDIFMREVREAATELLPVDSEHSAVFQALKGECESGVRQITLTASGGPFRTWSYDALVRATPEQALKHPNWSMGAKITIDSATLMNKGLELIEAYHLFPVSANQLEAIVHPQSVVHCLVEYCDGSVLAQLAEPDMRTPIAYALSWPNRISTPTRRLDLVKLASLTFEQPDMGRFPALRLAKQALQEGGPAPTVLNAANEEAVAAFLERRIGFMDIALTVERTMDAMLSRMGQELMTDIARVLEIDAETRVLARDVMAK